MGIFPGTGKTSPKLLRDTVCKERSPRQASRWGWGSRQDRFALLYLGFVMLMGLQRHACSRRNQLTAPVDVFLIRLFTLHGGRPTARHGTESQFWSVARGPQPPQLSVPLSTPRTQKAGGLWAAQPVPSSFQPPAQPLSPGCGCPVPSLCKGTCPGEVSHLGTGRLLCGQHQGLQNVSCRAEALLSSLLVCFQQRGGPRKGKGNSSLPGPEPDEFCLVWALGIEVFPAVPGCNWETSKK